MSQQNNTQKSINSTIINLIHTGKTTREIKDLLKEGFIDTNVKYSESQAHNLIYTIKKQMLTEFNEAKENLTAEIFDKFEHLYKKSYEAGDYKECRECLKEMEKIIGIGINQVNIARNKENEAIQIQFS